MLRAFTQPGPARAALRRNAITSSISGGVSRRHNNAHHARDYMVFHTTYNPDDNLPHLPPALPPLPNPPKGILLLLTPLYAPLLTTASSSLLASHLTTLLPPDNTSTIDILAAVVDDLPSYPSSPTNNAPHTSSILTHQRNEGWSWLITDEEGLINRTLSPSSTGSSATIQNPTTSSTEGNIDSHGRPVTKFTGRRANWGYELPIPLVFSFPNGKSVAIALANTFFQTGRLATLGRVSVRKGLEGGLIMFDDGGIHGAGKGWDTVNRVYRIVIPPLSKAEGDYKYTSRLPLIPLTAPRQILHCAGNILRELSLPEDPNTGIPASRELESAVDRYLMENPQVPAGRKLDIFALITPPGCEYPQRDRTGGFDPWDSQSGQKLRRVISGGGGWGKKMGLLSIDPQGLTYALSDDEYARLHYDDDTVAGDDGEEKRFKREFERRFFGAKDDIEDVRGPASTEEAETGEKRNKSEDDNNDDGTILSTNSTIQFFLSDLKTPPSPLPSSSASIIEQFLILGCIHKDTQPLVVDPLKEERKLVREKELCGDEVSYEMGKMRKGVQVPNVFGGRAEEGVWVTGEGGDEVGRGGKGKMDVPGGEVVVVVRRREVGRSTSYNWGNCIP
ncbi:hypothetical protein BGX38DRAFT_1269091 [Terfezia claveryi]|nr:hypothetical protein BGX38DRAFT_1269091 [Terfezia claveryi]